MYITYPPTGGGNISEDKKTQWASLRHPRGIDLLTVALNCSYVPARLCLKKGAFVFSAAGPFEPIETGSSCDKDLNLETTPLLQRLSSLRPVRWFGSIHATKSADLEGSRCRTQAGIVVDRASANHSLV